MSSSAREMARRVPGQYQRALSGRRKAPSFVSDVGISADRWNGHGIPRGQPRRVPVLLVIGYFCVRLVFITRKSRSRAF